MLKRILVIEDEPSLAKVLGKRLVTAGFEVRLAIDATFGIQEAHQFQPHLIVLDLMMPGGGGLFVLNAIRESARTFAIPVIVLTASQNEETRKKVLALGVEAFLEKPYVAEQLIAEVKRLLGEG